ncbi:MAG: selenide, water dikinase SelD, partial [Fidelibacterota bacterium]
LTEILNGGLSITENVGIPILGGHTIKDNELKYGLVVTGTIKNSNLVQNNTAKPGDILILTKPLGTGIITTAIKRNIADESMIDAVTDLMIHLNKSASEVMVKIGVNSCTDITGFGLLGHLLEMCNGSKVSAVIEFDRCPFLEGVFELAQKGIVPGGTKSNLSYVQKNTTFSKSLLPFQQLMLADAQTSGGLLISVSEEKHEELIDELNNRTSLSTAIIGKIYNPAESKIYVK